VVPSALRTRLRAQRANPTLGNILPGSECPTTRPELSGAAVEWLDAMETAALGQ